MSKVPKELPKTYDPGAYEDGVYAAWEKQKVFQPRSDNDAKLRKKLKPYSIVMPPPNATGILHTGHAIMIALEDALIRYHRMKGFDTLYLPGTDHAAIATASVVDRQLLEEKIDKQQLGRPAYVKRAKEFAQANKLQIENQIKGLGASADWNRNAFTMDKEREQAVVEAFKRLYKKGLIYRGDYMVNWCPVCRTVLADDEVEHREQEGVLYYMKYGPFELATTRPETKVGDTAVAVHPDDKRYKQYVGTEIEVEMINGLHTLKVVADEAVDPEFGTGAVKVTPFHDKTDYQIGQRHNLDAIEVIGEDGVMTEKAGKELAGLDRFKARKKMVDWLKKKNLLVKEEVMKHSVGRCYRSDTVIEPRISRQWFLNVTDLKKQALKFVDDDELKFIPKRYEKTYRDWIGKLHDWCISRQIWFGHPIPAYINKDGKISLTKKAGYTASTDTLDTWFSSALWPFSTLGWPKSSKDFERFFPNDVLETGYDIIFFWITRMVLMTIALDVKSPKQKKLKPPFHTSYLHGLVRDQRGRKFSKSLGNGIDPLELIGKYGTDALRFTLVTGGTPGNDIKFDEKRVVGSRNFANKIWNIARFIIAQEEPETDLGKLTAETLTTFDRAILHKLRETWLECERVFYDADDYAKSEPEPKAPNAPSHPRPYDMAHAGNTLYSFIWSDFADWYVEVAKVQLKDPDTHHNTNIILSYVLETILKLLHPFMPFITETIWTDGLNQPEMLALTEWPELHEDLDQPEDAERFEHIKGVVETIRRLRKDHHVPPGAWVQAILVTDEPGPLIDASDAINRLARLKMLRIVDQMPKGELVSAMSGTINVALPTGGLVDEAAEEVRLQGQIEAAKMDVERLSKRLDSKDYAEKAPEHVVAETKAKLKEAEARLEELQRQAG
ncbi:valine--tRNA ligase [Patescibacteria group bacterium]|nr:valine--tRNA ligase [Patescibacteria group bacterium]